MTIELLVLLVVTENEIWLEIVACDAVMEYIPCGELFALWKKLHNFSDALVRLYVAELGLVLGV